MSNILKINKPSDYSAWLGQTDNHELITVIDFEAVSPMPYSLNSYEVYGLFLQGKGISEDITYGTGKYDYSEGTLICVAPGQLGGREDDGKLYNMAGWAVLFHPDLIQGTALEHQIRNFSFFDYRINEALHMTDKEREVMISIIRQLQTELEFPSDKNQNRIIAGFINLLLRYSERFYNRQFETRRIMNNDILSRFETLLKEYFGNKTNMEKGLPSIRYFSEALNMSANYLSDVIKKTTGETASHMIRRHIVQLAKNRLISGMNSSEVAYSLGFDYPQHFARMFKKMTGMTPTAYCASRTKTND